MPFFLFDMYKDSKSIPFLIFRAEEKKEDWNFLLLKGLEGSIQWSDSTDNF